MVATALACCGRRWRPATSWRRHSDVWAVVDALEWVRRDVGALCRQLLRNAVALEVLVWGLLVGGGERDGSS